MSPYSISAACSIRSLWLGLSSSSSSADRTDSGCPHSLLQFTKSENCDFKFLKGRKGNTENTTSECSCSKNSFTNVFELQRDNKQRQVARGGNWDASTDTVKMKNDSEGINHTGGFINVSEGENEELSRPSKLKKAEKTVLRSKANFIIYLFVTWHAEGCQNHRWNHVTVIMITNDSLIHSPVSASKY